MGPQISKLMAPQMRELIGPQMTNLIGPEMNPKQAHGLDTIRLKWLIIDDFFYLNQML